MGVSEFCQGWGLLSSSDPCEFSREVQVQVGCQQQCSPCQILASNHGREPKSSRPWPQHNPVLPFPVLSEFLRIFFSCEDFLVFLCPFSLPEILEVGIQILFFSVFPCLVLTKEARKERTEKHIGERGHCKGLLHSKLRWEKPPIANH